MKTRVIAASAIAALLLVGVAAVAFANAGITLPGLLVNVQGPNHNSNNQDNGGNETSDSDDNENYSGHLDFSVNQTFSLNGLTGHSNLLPTNHTDHDPDKGKSAAQPATGNFTFTVTGVSDDAVNLTIASGWFTIGNQTFTVVNGTLTLNGEGRSGTGSGFATGNATFTIHIAGIHGNITSGALVGAIKLDVTAGTSEYHVILGTRED